jgi:hypothetical protein
VIFVGVAHGDAVAGEGPQLLDQAVLQFAVPLAGEEGLGLFTAAAELGTVAPMGIEGGECDLGRVAAVPAVLGQADFLDGAFG